MTAAKAFEAARAWVKETTRKYPFVSGVAVGGLVVAFFVSL